MIPEEIKQKIAKEFPIRQDTEGMSHQDLYPIMLLNSSNWEKQVGAEFGYSLAQSQLEEKDKEIETFKDAYIERNDAFNKCHSQLTAQEQTIEKLKEGLEKIELNYGDHSLVQEICAELLQSIHPQEG